MAIAPEQVQRIGIKRHFTAPDVHPYDTLEWESREARIPDLKSGGDAFYQPEVEFPVSWSQNATNIVAQKYFRGSLGTAEREYSVRQIVDRVADTITGWGVKDGYFTDSEEAEAFRAELKFILAHQRASFNSPVWFNIGVPGEPQQGSACFILDVDDTMDSILNWYREEGVIFKGGSGSGVNLSKIRSSYEELKGGGTASGPVSFMRGADASAGTIKSGGKTRRAAKMAILNVDHPDVEEFIWCKALEERKARALREAGFDMDLDGRDSHSIQYQNANNSVRVTDAFMKAVENDDDWDLKAVKDGTPVRTVKARDLMHQLAEAAWECADPGMQYDTTINNWHTAANTGRINASNPCCFVGDALVDTSAGVIPFEQLHKMYEAGAELPLVRSFALPEGRHRLRAIRRVWVAGMADELVDVVTRRGLRLRCTPEHRFLTRDGEFVEAASLVPGAELRAVEDDGSDTTDCVSSVDRVSVTEPVPVYDLEVGETHNFAVTSEGRSLTHSVVVHNSEYMHLDNSACNLASINLLRYLEDDGSFDVEGYKHTVEVMFTAQEIIVGNADYPTEKIGENARKFRQLGLGYANLGALLMARGAPYDSEEGRAWAAALTALMTGHAYATSARTASRMGTFAGYDENREPTLKVLNQHRAACAEIDEELVDADLLDAARQSWDEACDLGDRYGVRNAQATVLAPTGTIGLAMDCDTTGVEPDLALTKHKKLVGGGTMEIVNRTIPRALRNLEYDDAQVDEIVAYIDEHKTIVGAPSLNPEHLAVFATAMGDNVIHYMGHVRMMAAVQPFISGAISKTINMPEDVTVEEVSDLYLESWKLGLKAVALYRDNCKVAQPLSTQKKAGAAAAPEVERVVETVIIQQPVRQKLQKTRNSKTFSFRVADCKGYCTVGEFEDGRPGELFLKVAKQGSTLAGIMDSFAIGVSLGLQYGVPLRAFVEKYTSTRFEPAGMTDDKEIRFASSLVDYIFRRLAVQYMDVEERSELGIHTVSERTQPTLPGVEEAVTPSQAADFRHPELDFEPAADEDDDYVDATEAPAAQAPAPAPAPARMVIDAPLCTGCGAQMRPSGSCYVCTGCGSTSGCS